MRSAAARGARLGFIGFIVRPLFLELSRLLPEASQLVEQLGQTEDGGVGRALGVGALGVGVGGGGAWRGWAADCLLVLGLLGATLRDQPKCPKFT